MTADDDLDALLHAVRSRFRVRSDASFDFGAGLADVYERASMQRAADLLDLAHEAEPSERPHVERQQADQRQRARRRRGDDGGSGHRAADGG